MAHCSQSPTLDVRSETNEMFPKARLHHLAAYRLLVPHPLFFCMHKHFPHRVDLFSPLPLLPLDVYVGLCQLLSEGFNKVKVTERGFNNKACLAPPKLRDVEADISRGSMIAIDVNHRGHLAVPQPKRVDALKMFLGCIYSKISPSSIYWASLGYIGT